MSITITAPEALDDATAQAATALAARCNQAEGIDLPIAPEVSPMSGMLLAYAEGELAGVAAISYGHECEVYLWVEPGQRRRGIGRALALAAREAVVARGHGPAILVADAAGSTGRAFATAMGARLDYAEHQLELDLAAVPPAPPALPGLRIRLGQPEDGPAVIEILMAAFGDPIEIVAPFVNERIGTRAHRFLLAEQDGRAVGTLRLVKDGDWVYVTTFGVRPEAQGRGIGRRVLLQAIAMLRGEGQEAIRIEVVTDNEPALGLYSSCGFHVKHTYAYLLLPETL